MKIEERISKIQEYIDGITELIPLAPDERRKSDLLAYWGFAMLIKELYELHLPDVARTREQIKMEKEREETVDWMTRWLKDQSKGLEKP